MDNKAKYLERPWLKFYGEGVPADVAIPEISLGQALDESAKKWPNRTALVFYGQKMSYQELREYSDRFATALYDLGIRKGDRIAFLLLTCPQFVIAFFGALKIGAIVTGISPLYVSHEIKRQLLDSGAETIILQDIFYDAVEKTGVKLKKVILTNIAEFLPPAKRLLGKSILRAVYQKMAVPSPKITSQEGFYQFKDLIKKYPPQPPQVAIDPKEDVAVLSYTGGTTGWPKLVMLTHYNFVGAVSNASAFWSDWVEPGKEVTLMFFPLYHMGGMFVMIVWLMRGDTVVLLATPDPEDILSSIENYGVTIFHALPTLFEVFIVHEKTNRVNWKRLKGIISGMDTLREASAKGWERRTGAPIDESYGLTEALVTHYAPRHKNRLGSFGVPITGVIAAVINPESRDFLPPGEIGELILKTPAIIKGYWNSSGEAESALIKIDGETWLRTGDLVKMSEDGYFYFYDRIKDVIKYKGYSVYAREVEEVIAQHPSVKSVGVVPSPDPLAGSNVRAVVVLRPEARGKVSEADIIKFCEDKLAHYKIPKIVEFWDDLPKSYVGKILKRELRKEEF
ncbi:MAG: AMP-binding protein [Chloroflexi bacterium]|nr:AMP-binding protein [Chloroflexota bacterium]